MFLLHLLVEILLEGKNCPFFVIYLFPYSTIYLYQYGLMIVIVFCGLKSIIVTYFVTQIVLILVLERPFRLAPLPFQYSFILSWALPFFLAQDIPGSSCIFPDVALESTTSTQNPGSFYLRIVFKNQDLDTRCSHCY